MVKFLRIIIFVVFIPLLASGQSERIKIVVLGSSTAAGTGPSHPDSAWVKRYLTFLRTLNPNNDIVNLAVGGWTTYHIMPTGFSPPPGRPSPQTGGNITRALTFEPDAIIINLPSNDVANGYSIAEQLANYDSILAAANAENVPVWISTTQPRNFSSSGRQKQVEMRDSTFARFGEKAIDFWTDIAGSDNRINPIYNSGDGVHLNDAGHRILFERVVEKHIPDTVLVTGIEDDRNFPFAAALSANYPNPFNPATTIPYRLKQTGHVILEVFNIAGQKVAELVNQRQPAGQHSIRFDPKNLNSGIYFYRLRLLPFSGKTIVFQKTRKMLLVK